MDGDGCGGGGWGAVPTFEVLADAVAKATGTPGIGGGGGAIWEAGRGGGGGPRWAARKAAPEAAAE